MSLSRSLEVNDEVLDFVRDVSLREPDVLARLRAETSHLRRGTMQVTPEQGQFLALLAQAVGARRCLELGTFTGYSALVVALALPPDGTLVACDVSDEWTAIARRYWAEAGVAHKMELRLAPAIETLDALLAEGQAGTFDFAFVDAIKEEYPAYYERVLQLLRPGGLVLFDNMLGTQRVRVGASPREDPHLASIVAFNQQLTHDERITLSLLPLWMGVTLALKR